MCPIQKTVKNNSITFCVWKLWWSEKVPVEIILKKSHKEKNERY